MVTWPLVVTRAFNGTKVRIPGKDDKEFLPSLSIGENARRLRCLPMKISPLLLLAAGVLLAAAMPTHAQGWKTAGTETMPAPAEGIVHHVRTLEKTGPAPIADGNGTATPMQATLHFVSFEAPRYTFAVFDQGDLGRESLGEIMAHHHALAGVNGGYFSPDFEPVGLLVSEGKMIHRPSRARLLSGALVATGNHIAIRRSTEPLPGKNAREAVQCGPFLVEDGKPVPGLNNVRSARRTVVFTAGRHIWGLASTSSLTLEELGAILADPALLPGELKIERAINLDGGSSTGMWAEEPGQAAPFYLHEIGIVRDFVAVVPRERAR